MQDNPRTLSCAFGVSEQFRWVLLSRLHLSDILYVDLSRYTGSPIAKVRSQMKYWMEKASWHKPSLLVLDNIDKLMGTELEVCDSIADCGHLTEPDCHSAR